MDFAIRYVKTGCKIKGKCRFIKFLFAFYRLVCYNNGQIELFWVDIDRIFAVLRKGLLISCLPLSQPSTLNPQLSTLNHQLRIFSY